MNMLRDDHHHVGDSFEVNHKHGVPIKYCPGAPQKKKNENKIPKDSEKQNFSLPWNVNNQHDGVSSLPSLSSHQSFFFSCISVLTCIEENEERRQQKLMAYSFRNVLGGR